VTTFADQAAIAIENVRLFNELRESLQQQTATADILAVISSSQAQLKPVFETIVDRTTRICEATFACLGLFEEKALRFVAISGASADSEFFHPDRLHQPDGCPYVLPLARAKRTAQTQDLRAETGYRERDPFYVTTVDVGGARVALRVPLLKENKLLGHLWAFRQEIRPFSDKQVDLVKNFANQAVIAIENTRLLNELRQRTNDLTESLEQQTATSDVLKIISSAPGDLEPVFKAMLAKAIELCEANFGAMWLVDGDDYRTAALHGNLPEAYAERWRSGTLHRPKAVVPMVRAVRSHNPVHVPDMLEDKGYLQGDPLARSVVDIAGIRTLLTVPMLKENEAVGVITIYRNEVRSFSDKQIALLKNFAAQAVIAIENARLLSELRESLQQQTATADVLKVISSSPGELKPVFQAMLEQATHICDAKFGIVFRYEGGLFHPAATLDLPPALADFMIKQGAFPPKPGQLFGCLCESKTVINVVDRATDPEPSPSFRFGGARSSIAVPMLKDDELVGALFIYRTEVRPFTEKQIDLVRNFAAQAVIAIENARLLNELRKRTDDLSESLHQQTATADVLKVISASPGDLEPVFKAMLANATRLCNAEFGTLNLYDGKVFRIEAVYNVPAPFAETRLHELILPHPSGGHAQVVRTKDVVQIEDIRKGQAYLDRDPAVVAVSDLGGARTIVLVPMLKDDVLVGTITIFRQEVMPFSDKQIELVKNFASQAVIAIENARLLSELRESLQQQTATADVLKVISHSTFDLQTVLDTLTESAARLCEADIAAIIRQRDQTYYWATSYGLSAELGAYVRSLPNDPGRTNVAGRALMTGKTVHVHDVLADPEYARLYLDAQKKVGHRATLAVPLLREGTPIGIVLLMRRSPQPFTDKQIELVETFADQAVIAIENVRLFDEVQARTRELAASLEDLRTTQDRLVQTQKLASLGQLTAGIAHEIKNPLNFVNNFSNVSSELIDELQDALKAPLEEKVLAEVSELATMLRGNLDKIVQHGKRADAIVKNMLLHSREGSGEHRPVDINVLVEESLNLAYHGARAEKQGFNIILERSFDPAAEQADVFPQDITRVLLNLILNGFYAATKRKAEAEDGYEPTLMASTRSLGDRVEIRVRDNGTGILPEVKEKIFNPFFTTKPAGEGTGLGLSISHDIIVKQHGGSIEVESEPGEYTEFRIILPRRAAFITTSGAQS